MFELSPMTTLPPLVSKTHTFNRMAAPLSPPELYVPRTSELCPINIMDYLNDKNYTIQAPQISQTAYANKHQVKIQCGGPPHIESPSAMESKFDNMIINTSKLGFIIDTKSFQETITLQILIHNFFRSRSCKKVRFEHKLWNALLLTKHYEYLYPVIGVKWLSSTIFKVDRRIFGNLLRVSSPAAAFFNSRGSFMTHGFLEISREKAQEMEPGIDLTGVDEALVRLFVHSQNCFNQFSTDADILFCRWNSIK